MHFLRHYPVADRVLIRSCNKQAVFIFHQDAPERSYWRNLPGTDDNVSTTVFHLIPLPVRHFERNLLLSRSVVIIGLDAYLTIVPGRKFKRSHGGRRKCAIRKPDTVASLAWDVMEGPTVPGKPAFKAEFRECLKRMKCTRDDLKPPVLSEFSSEDKQPVRQEEELLGPIADDADEDVRLHTPISETGDADMALDRRDDGNEKVPMLPREGSQDSATQAYQTSGLVRPDTAAGAASPDRVLANEDWEQCKKIIYRGRPRKNQEDRDRGYMGAIVFIGKHGLQWRDLPKEFGKWRSIYSRYERWNTDETWNNIASYLKTRGYPLDCASLARKRKSKSVPPRVRIAVLEEKNRMLEQELAELKDSKN